MKKITFGTPESLTPVNYCKGFSYRESEIAYPTHEIQFELTSHGCLLRLPLCEDEHFYGLGLQLKAFDLRGRKFTIRPNADPLAPTGDSHAPVPFFVSTKGYGIYVDTARYAEFYFGNAKRLQAPTFTEENRTIAVSTDELYQKSLVGRSTIDIHIPVAKGVDIYIMEGDTITDVVAKYNLLAGGGCEVPEWGLGAIYRCYGRYNQEQVLAMAKSFKEDELPISIIGLEPGWQTQVYSCSYVWSPERFPDPQGLIDTLRGMGYHVNLWEHAFTHPTSPIYGELSKYSGSYEVWGGCVPDFTLPEAKKIFADHHKKIVAMGVDGFKLDECDGSDFTGGWSFPNHAKFPGGLDGDQYHSLIGTLYMQTMLDALEGKPTLSEVRCAGALCAPYPFVLYSDLYEHPDFIRGCATAGFSGILWTPEVRDSSSKTPEELIRRLQANVFSVQCLINAWYCEQKPWELLGCSDEVKYWLNVRESLIPRLKAAFDRYHEYGIPPVRALVSDYTDDRETYGIDNQYIFGDDLIVAPIPVGKEKRRVYLPAGEWADYFTGERVESGWFEVETKGIPVYRKVK